MIYPFNKFLTITIIVITSACYAQLPYSVAFERCRTDPLLLSSHLAFQVREVVSGNVTYDWNGNKNMVPASTLKLITTASAVGILGADFKFETQLAYTGTIDSISGTLNGNLYLLGNGDPTWGSFRYKTLPQFFDSILVSQIKKLKIKKINGAIVVDASAFDQNPIPDYYSWSDMGNYYGTGAYALNVHENLYYLDLQPNGVNDSTVVLGTRPSLSLDFANKIKTGQIGSGDNAFIYGGPFDNFRYLQGTIPAGKSIFTIKGALPNPPLYMANYIHQLIINQQVKIDKMPFVTYEPITQKKNIIYQFYSPSLKEIITQTNHKSINLYAEALLKTIGYRVYRLGTINNGVKAIKAYWGKKNVDFNNVNLYDGSGLSPANGISARVFTNMIHKMYNDKKFNIFFESLPVAAQSGTLSNLCKGTLASNNLRAKSGNINNVTAYTGYVKNKAGVLLCFSIIANQYSCDNSYVIKQFEKVLNALAE